MRGGGHAGLDNIPLRALVAAADGLECNVAGVVLACLSCCELYFAATLCDMVTEMLLAAGLMRVFGVNEHVLLSR